MSEEYGPNFVTLTDEEGNDIELEYVDALEDNDDVQNVWHSLENEEDLPE